MWETESGCKLREMFYAALKMDELLSFVGIFKK